MEISGTCALTYVTVWYMGKPIISPQAIYSFIWYLKKGAHKEKRRSATKQVCGVEFKSKDWRRTRRRH